MFKRVLVPLDGSRLGLRALRYATEISQRFGAEIALLQVIKSATPVITAGAPGVASPVASEATVQVALDEEKETQLVPGDILTGKPEG